MTKRKVNKASKVDATLPVVDATTSDVAEVVAPRIKTVDDLRALAASDASAAKELELQAKTSARNTYGTDTTGSKDEQGNVRRDKNGHIIPVYTPHRPADVVATDEIMRLERLQWAQDARTACAASASKLQRDLTEKETVKIILQHAKVGYVHKSVLSAGYGSRLIWQRTFDAIAPFGRLATRKA